MNTADSDGNRLVVNKRGCSMNKYLSEKKVFTSLEMVFE